MARKTFEDYRKAKGRKSKEKPLRSDSRGRILRESRTRLKGKREDSGSRNRRGPDGGYRGRDDKDKYDYHKVTCDQCGKKCEVPFKPTKGKPVLCSECFEKKGGKKGSIDLSEIHEKLDKIMKVLNID